MIARVREPDLTRLTPCGGWDLRALIGHMVGQNHGFAAAVHVPDAPLAAFADQPADPAGVQAAWQASAERVAEAFESAALDRKVLLIEIHPRTRFPVASAVAFHLLDTVVHTWDVATALGDPFRPDEELIETTVTLARAIPDGAVRLEPGSLFAPALPRRPSGDSWEHALALVGRSSANEDQV